MSLYHLQNKSQEPYGTFCASAKASPAQMACSSVFLYCERGLYLRLPGARVRPEVRWLVLRGPASLVTGWHTGL